MGFKISVESKNIVLTQDGKEIMVIDTIDPYWSSEATSTVTAGLAIFAGLKMLSESLESGK